MLKIIDVARGALDIRRRKSGDAFYSILKCNSKLICLYVAVEVL